MNATICSAVRIEMLQLVYVLYRKSQGTPVCNVIPVCNVSKAMDSSNMEKKRLNLVQSSCYHQDEFL